MASAADRRQRPFTLTLTAAGSGIVDGEKTIPLAADASDAWQGRGGHGRRTPRLLRTIRHSTDTNRPTDEADDGAIALDPDHAGQTQLGKRALLPGQTATFANYTSYDSGINGIMVDIAGLPVRQRLTADDFQFLVGNSNDPAELDAVPGTDVVDVLPGMGDNGVRPRHAHLARRGDREPVAAGDRAGQRRHRPRRTRRLLLRQRHRRVGQRGRQCDRQRHRRDHGPELLPRRARTRPRSTIRTTTTATGWSTGPIRSSPGTTRRTR